MSRALIHQRLIRYQSLVAATDKLPDRPAHPRDTQQPKSDADLVPEQVLEQVPLVPEQVPEQVPLVPELLTCDESAAASDDD